MSEGDRLTADRRPDVPRDDAYAQAYAEGYGEGLRDALRELLSHLSRGHTPHEVRMIVESRLARVREEVELKRRSLLAPPRNPSWPALLRPPAAAVETAASRTAPPTVAPGASVLFLEPRPERALACAEASAGGFARVVVLSFHPPSLRGVPTARVELIPIRPGSDREPVDLPALSTRLLRSLGAGGGSLLYLDAVEVLASQSGAEPTSKFVMWLAGQVAGGPSALVVSADGEALDARSRGLFQRTFNRVE